MAVVAVKTAEVVLQIARAVAHRVRVFAQYVRLADAVFLEIGVDLLDRGVHPAVQVEIGLVDLLALGREGRALVVGQAGGS